MFINEYAIENKFSMPKFRSPGSDDNQQGFTFRFLVRISSELQEKLPNTVEGKRFLRQLQLISWKHPACSSKGNRGKVSIYFDQFVEMKK
jgi:hypothetical protein